MNKSLITAIEDLDIATVEEHLKREVDLTGITLSFVIEQYGEANEDMLWVYASEKGDLDILRRVDKQKAAIVELLIKAGVGFDEDCLVLCYTFRCPKTAKVLLTNGANPNINWGGFESILLYIRMGRHYVGFNEASEVLLSQLEKIL